MAYANGPFTQEAQGLRGDLRRSIQSWGDVGQKVLCPAAASENGRKSVSTMPCYPLYAGCQSIAPKGNVAIKPL
jgi:hypothetical protein